MFMYYIVGYSIFLTRGFIHTSIVSNYILKIQLLLYNTRPDNTGEENN